VEIGAEVLIKATKVDGIYDSDPVSNANAKRFDQISYFDFINSRYEVMDTTAVTLCMENKLPIMVLNFWKDEGLEKALQGMAVGTLVTAGEGD
jgi:uridylate kinase